MDETGGSQGPQTNMLAGILLFMVSLFLLLCFCCCFRDMNRSKNTSVLNQDKNALAIVETDSSGSEADQVKKVYAIDAFLKGRQAAWSEGLRDEAVDAYAIGYMDGVDAAREKKSMLSDDQVSKLAKKLGYGGKGVGAYAQGFQYGFRNKRSVSSLDVSKTVHYETGLINAEAYGLRDNDRDSYAKGYAQARAISPSDYLDDDLALLKLAQKFGFTGSLADIFVSGYQDGAEGIIMTDILGPSAAFRKGLSNANDSALNDDEAIAHATGFQQGYAMALVGDGNDRYSREQMTIMAAETGYTGKLAKHWGAGFVEGLDEGKPARDVVSQKGFQRAGGLGLTRVAATAFATGYKDGVAYHDEMSIKEKDINKTARELFGSDDADRFYIRGFEEGQVTQSMGRQDLAHPSFVFECAFSEAHAANPHDTEASVAHAIGRQEGYTYGLAGGRIKPDKEVMSMALDRGLDDNAHALEYLAGFQRGIVQGFAARDILFQKGRGRAVGIGLTLAKDDAYAYGYRDGFSETVNEENELSEVAMRKRAKKLGLNPQLTQLYVKGSQHGRRDANEFMSAGRPLSAHAACRMGLLRTKSLDLDHSARGAFLTAYREGYQVGMTGSEEVVEDDLRATMLEHNFDKESTKKAFMIGFSEGCKSGFATRQRQNSMILSPIAAWSRGYEGAGSGDAHAFAAGFGDGYCTGVNCHQCPTGEQLSMKASGLGLNVTSYLEGGQEGFRKGRACAIKQNVLSLDTDGALQRGLIMAASHGMKGSVAGAYQQGYRDGYSVELAPGSRSDLTRGELKTKAMKTGLVKYTLLHAYTSGYLAGQADGGAAILHHSLSDVHRCHSGTCRTCLTTQELKFIQIQNSSTHLVTKEKNAMQKSWWTKKKLDHATDRTLRQPDLQSESKF